MRLNLWKGQQRARKPGMAKAIEVVEKIEVIAGSSISLTIDIDVGFFSARLILAV
jgi:hypothetical protein